MRGRLRFAQTSLILSLIGCVSLLSFPYQAQAQIIFTEVYPAPNEGGKEWFELYNASEESQNLAHWTVYDQLSKASKIYQFLEEPSSLLAPHEVRVIELTSAVLNNDKDGLDLKNASGELVTSFKYTSSQVGLSWQRRLLDADDWWLDVPTPGSWSPKPIQTPTPSPNPSPSSTPTPNPSSSPSPTPSPHPTPSITPVTDYKQLLINEVMSCPLSPETEWVELLNQGAVNLKLDNWSLLDGQKNRIIFNLEIAPGKVAIIEWVRAILNNAGDLVILEDEQGEERARLEIPACPALGQSYAWINSAYHWTEEPSRGYLNPNQVNSPSSPAPSATKTISPQATAKQSNPPQSTENQRFQNDSLAPTTRPLLTPRPQAFKSIATTQPASASASLTSRQASSSTKLSASSTESLPEWWIFAGAIMSGGFFTSAGLLFYDREKPTPRLD